MTVKTSLKSLPNSAIKKPNNGTISVLFYSLRNPLNVRNFCRHQVSREKRQMIFQPFYFCHFLHTRKTKYQLKNSFKFSYVHGQDLFMQLFDSFIICFFLHTNIHFLYFFLWCGFLFFDKLSFLFGHWNSLKVTWDAFFCKSGKMNLILAFVRSDFGSKRTSLFFKFLFLFFLF